MLISAYSERSTFPILINDVSFESWNIIVTINVNDHQTFSTYKK